MFIHGLREVAHVWYGGVLGIITIWCITFWVKYTVKKTKSSETPMLPELKKALAVIPSILSVLTLLVCFIVSIWIYNPLEESPYEANKKLIGDSDELTEKSQIEIVVTNKTEDPNVVAEEENTAAMTNAINLFRGVK